MRISDWSSDVCSSDLIATIFRPTTLTGADAAKTGARFERVDLQGQGIRLQPLPGGVVPVSTPEPSAPDPLGQIKTRQRVRDLAEVFTHEREVKAMLDLIPDMFPAGSSTRAVDAKFLEPACGSGNFLAEILDRKSVV